MSNHSFDIEIAQAYGVNAAILYNNLLHWSMVNKANGTNQYDGRYWTYNSRSAFTKLFPYLSEHQIKAAFDKLIDAGVVVTGNYNEDRRDRSLWYALTEYGWSIGRNCIVQLQKSANANGKNASPLPDLNTDIDTDINTDIRNPSDSCAEPEKPASTPQEPTVFTLPLNDGTEHRVTQADFDKYESFYPAVDVMQELRKMAGWLDGNPKNRKTKSGIRRFINSWLARAQDQGNAKKRKGSGGSGPGFDRTTSDNYVPLGANDRMI